jgi:RimJ/RimL family protein N-acetyltransferase
MLISELMHQRRRRELRAWTVADASDELAGVFVVSRMCIDSWNGYVSLLDRRSAGHVAALIDASPALTVAGIASDVAPLFDLVKRAREIRLSRWVVVDPPVAGIVPPPADRTRLATPLDQPALVEFFAGYEYVPVPTRWQLRSWIESMLRRYLVIVCEEDGEIIGVVTSAGATRRVLLVGDLSVPPQHRERGVAWELLRAIQPLASGLGLGVSMVLAPSNPMTFDHPRVHWMSENHAALLLRPPQRLRGEGRLRNAYRKIQPVTPRTPRFFVDPHDPDRPAPTT